VRAVAVVLCCVAAFIDSDCASHAWENVGILLKILEVMQRAHHAAFLTDKHQLRTEAEKVHCSNEKKNGIKWKCANLLVFDQYLAICDFLACR